MEDGTVQFFCSYSLPRSQAACRKLAYPAHVPTNMHVMSHHILPTSAGR